MQQSFDPLEDETWLGGFYEAAVILGSSRDPGADEKVAEALRAAWLEPSMQACAIGDRKSWDWSRVRAPLTLSVESHTYGALHVPEVGPLPVTTLIVREEQGDDWLYIGVPLGGIEASDGYPFGDPEELLASRTWRTPLEQALASIVLSVGRHVIFKRAAIGFEIAGAINAAPDDERRYVGLIERQGDRYVYLPTTDWG